MYDLSDVVGLSTVSSVPAGGLLVAGSPMTGTTDLVLDVLADGLERDEGAVMITTGSRGETMIADIADRATDVSGQAIQALDCRADGSRERETLLSGETVYSVTSPSDMTGLGISITEALDRFGEAGYDRVRVGLDTLSTMLVYTDTATVFQFCQVLSSRLETAGHVGLFTIDPGAHDDRALRMLHEPMDGLVEIREDAGDRWLRYRNGGDEVSEWHRF
ncbi:MAG: hypothetical protein ABEH56_06610 [Salinirussus sp.]